MSSKSGSVVHKSASVPATSSRGSQNVTLPKIVSSRSNRSASIASSAAASDLRPSGSSNSPKMFKQLSGRHKPSRTNSVSSKASVFATIAGQEGAADSPIDNITTEELLELRSFVEPPAVVKRTLQLTCLILNAAAVKEPKAEPSWTEVKTRLAKDSFLQEIRHYDMALLRDAPCVIEFIKAKYFNDSEPLAFTRVRRASRAAAALFRWSATAVNEQEKVPDMLEMCRWWQCTDCGEDNRLSRQSCNNCGASTKWWVCEFCEESNKISRQHCNNCGAAQVKNTRQIDVGG